MVHQASCHALMWTDPVRTKKVVDCVECEEKIKTPYSYMKSTSNKINAKHQNVK